MSAFLQCISNCTVDVETNAVKVCGNGGVKYLVLMVLQWHRSDKDNRHIGIRRSLLTILKHATTSGQMSVA
jgi:hypothetical protein